MGKLLKFVDLLLRITGQNIFKDTFYVRVMSVTCVSTLSFILILGLVEPFTRKMSVTELAELFELFGPYFQSVTKIMIHNYYKSRLQKLRKEVNENLWSPHEIGPEKEEKKNKVLTLLFYCSATQYIGLLICGSVIALMAVTSSTRALPFGCYQIYDYDSHALYYWTIFIIQVFNGFTGPTFVTAVDSLFLDFVAKLLYEIWLLSEAIQNLNLEDVKNETDETSKFVTLKEYIKHHDMLLSMFKNIKKIYSPVLLSQFVASTPSLCIGLYNLSTGQGTILLLLRGFSFITVFLLQLFVYCFAGSMIKHQCSKMSDYAFYSGWQEPCGKKLRQAINMVVQRSQRTPQLTAAGIFDANLGTFGRILKFSISFYTLMSKKRG